MLSSLILSVVGFVERVYAAVLEKDEAHALHIPKSDRKKFWSKSYVKTSIQRSAGVFEENRLA